jgi:hypothetical protein
VEAGVAHLLEQHRAPRLAEQARQQRQPLLRAGGQEHLLLAAGDAALGHQRHGLALQRRVGDGELERRRVAGQDPLARRRQLGHREERRVREPERQRLHPRPLGELEDAAQRHRVEVARPAGEAHAGRRGDVRGERHTPP